MNRPERKTQSLTANLEKKKTIGLKSKVGKKAKRWKKALAAAQQPASE